MKSREQINYALRRLSQITDAKRTKVRKKFTTPAKPPTVAEVIRKIKSGKLVLAPHVCVDRAVQSGDTLRNLFDLDLYSKVEHKGLSEALVEIDAEEVRLRDKLMLGDCAEALKLLEDYSKS